MSHRRRRNNGEDQLGIVVLQYFSGKVDIFTYFDTFTTRVTMESLGSSFRL